MAVLMLPASALNQNQRRCSNFKDFPLPEGLNTPASTTPVMKSKSLKDFRVSDGTRTPVHDGLKTPASMTPATMSHNLKEFRISDGSRTPATMTPVEFIITPCRGTPTPCRSPSSLLFRGRLGPSRHAASHSSLGPLPVDPFQLQQLQDTTPACGEQSTDTATASKFLLKSSLQPKERIPCNSDISVAVVAPGGGTGINASVYSALGREEGFSVRVLGQSRAPYDRYPSAWGGDGAPPPNLETFALDLAAQKCLDKADCLIVGSRGGQVVLPTLWKAQVDVPPTIVMNGGCAMSSLPISVPWPENAVTFLLIGGNDYFRGHVPVNEYVQDTQKRVPSANASTAILLVNEMTHMPQAQLLTSILSTMIAAVTSWRSSGDAPLDDFKTLLAALRQGRWTGVLSFKSTPGDKWEVESFS